jgi:hypothetical protein
VPRQSLLANYSDIFPLFGVMFDYFMDIFTFCKTKCLLIQYLNIKGIVMPKKKEGNPSSREKNEKTRWRRFLAWLEEANKASLKTGCKT